MPRAKRDDTVRVPLSLRDEVEQISGLTDGFCQEHLDAAYEEVNAEARTDDGEHEAPRAGR